MLNTDPNSACGLLYIDDEEKALKYFRMAFSQKFKVFTAESGKEGLELLQRESKNIGIVISDQRMPDMLGAEVLGVVREKYPHIVRILTTAYSDLESAIQAVNKGHIYQYVVKPWEIPELGMVLQRAADYYHVLSERNQLLSLKMTTLQRIICSDRLKWLLLIIRSWSEPEQAAFLRALQAFVQSIPDAVGALPGGADKMSYRDFDIAALISDEYRNGSQCVDLINSIRHGKPGSEAVLPEPLASQVKKIAGGEQVGDFLSALISQYSLAPEDIELVAGSEAPASVQIVLKSGKTASISALGRRLFGLLVKGEAPELSLALFGLLLALVSQKGSLSISTAGDAGQIYDFDLTQDLTYSPNDVISLLYEKFSQWDISRL